MCRKFSYKKTLGTGPTRPCYLCLASYVETWTQRKVLPQRERIGTLTYFLYAGGIKCRQFAQLFVVDIEFLTDLGLPVDEPCDGYITG
jgi:hypothetical protein